MGTVLSSVKYTPDGVPYYTLDDFRCLEKLDNGGYGTVMKAWVGKKRPVAVKLFSRTDAYSEREIEILKTHSHPHIVELFGVIWDGATKDIDGTTKMPLCSGYVMEYLELGSLHNEIHDVSKHYDMKLILLWIQQIGYGLQYLHEHEILHRDVKPSNQKGSFKIGRFWVGKDYFCSTGTLVYMAPEIITSKDYGPPADVYSFGVTIWEIIHRIHPRKYLTISKNIWENGCVELPIDPDEDFSSLLRRCWKTNVNERPSIKEIIHCPISNLKYTILIMGADLDNNKMVVWNRKTSTWTISQKKLFRFHSETTVYLDDELYLINTDKSLSKLDKNMKWRRLADMNEERGWINNTCLEWNGYIWVFGGFNGEKGCLKSVERYDPKEDKWTLMPDMKYGRGGAAAAVCNGKIYICGGRGGKIGDGVYWKSVECFDPESGVWTELTDIPTPRDYHSLICYRNKLVVIGGWDRKEKTTTVLELDPHEKNGQWKELPPLLYTSFHSVVAVLGPEIITIGGDNTNDSPTSVHIFNGINWRVGPSFPSIFPRFSSAVRVPQEFADRLSFLFRSI